MPWPFGRTKPLGPRGEALARRSLRRAGLKVLARNYRCPAGEIDLIALDPSTRAATGAETIVFIEVKTRSGGGLAEPEAAVDARKRRQVRRVADYYLATHKTGDLNIRFDIISIVLPEGARPRIRHIVEAF